MPSIRIRLVVGRVLGLLGRRVPAADDPGGVVERELAVVPLINDWMTAAALIVPISFSTSSILKKDLRATLARFSYHSTGDLALIIEQPPGTRMADRQPIAFSVTLALPA